MRLEFTPPGKNEPGFLRRQRRAVELTSIDWKKAKPEDIDTLVEFLADYVTEPKDRGKAVDALLDASEAEFLEMLGALTGGGENSAVPPTKPEAS